jgi:hypothetical protein
MYRVDRREFAVGTVIVPPDNRYQEKGNLAPAGIIIETALQQSMPANMEIDRRTGLFVFAELSDAIRFLSVLAGGKVYKVVSTPMTRLYHRGDMNFTEIMRRFLDNEPALATTANSYWRGEKTFKPCWEMLFNEVQVTRVIVGNETERAAIIAEYRNANGNVENMARYQELL